MASSSSGPLAMRQEESVDEKLLRLMSDPFTTQVASDSILIAIGTSLCITAAIFFAFCVLRPFNQIVYAPRLRHADEKHRPPPMGKSLFAWWTPVFRTKEQHYMHTMGMDAAVFLRIARMCRNMFIALAIVGCLIIIPINVSKSKVYDGQTRADKNIIFLMTPKDLFGNAYWAFVIVAYAFDIIVCGFLWFTYRAIHRLRRNYMDTPEYQNSLNARTLMATDIKKSMRSDQGIVEITDSLRTVPEVPRASIGRNVKDIPELIEEHEKAVIELEQVLSKYLKNPNSLPTVRPMCKPSKKDPEFTNKNEKVDAINYLTARIQRLEEKVRQARETVDKRDAMPYGFASYETIESAHTVAFAARSKHPKGSTVQLAPKPKDIIWKNLPLDPKTRRWRRIINRFWITLLTALYFIPNALIAVFLAQPRNIALLYEDFGTEMNKHPRTWAVVQGLAAPALTSLFYYFLPIIFRRLSVKAGDLTKTSRERHVISQLFSFFVFNNLFVFSLFGAVFKLIFTAVGAARDGGGKNWLQVLDQVAPFTNVMIALCDISPFWITWLVQRNLGAAIDLSQAVNLGWGSFSRKFLNPTPRELITRTAPPPFDYASYYNYYLFYSTVALCFGALQPITLVVTAFYFSIDSPMKKYLLLYVFCTKNETGGLYWRTVFNRFLVGTFMANCIIALMVGARGDQRNMMLGAMAPIPLLLIGFKFYCKNTYDNSMRYYTKGESSKGVETAPVDKEARRRDRVGVRFGHPALYQKLTVPMVHEKSKHLLSEVYRGRLDGDIGSTAGYSDVYSMKRMSKEHPGKVAGPTGPFEFVSENNMDFENFKNRPEFSDEHGGEGSVYGNISRPGTPSTAFGGERGRSSSRDSQRTFSPEDNGVTYPAGYHHTPSNLRDYSPGPGGYARSQANVSDQYHMPPDHSNLLRDAAPMGHQTPYSPYTPEPDGGRNDYFRGPPRL